MQATHNEIFFHYYACLSRFFLLDSVSKTSVSVKPFWIQKALTNPKTMEQSSFLHFKIQREKLKFKI
jgi:hypothetical protein